MKGALGLITISTLLFGCPAVQALDPSLDISQYAHTAWTFRDGFPVGNIFAIAQTSDGYFWLGGEFGLFQFDGVRSRPWQPPAGQQLPDRFVFRLLGARDGTLWIGTFSGLATWDGVRLIQHPEFAGRQLESLFEDHEGTVWAATQSGGTRFTRLCAMRRDSTQCFGDDGSLGRAVSALYEDPSGTLWVCAESGLWRWRPGPPRRQSAEPRDISALTKTEDGRTLMARYGGGLMQLAGDKLQVRPIPYLVPGPIVSKRPLAELDANELLRDRNGGLWIGTVEHGLIHVYHGRTDVFTKSDGLSGDVVLSLFEDREGTIWVSTMGGLDRFREFSVATMSSKQGLASDAVASVLADRDGSVWVGTHEGLTRWKNGQTTTFRKANGLPDDHVESLFQDDRGRLWMYAGHELAYFAAGRFIALPHAVPGEEDVYSITGDHQGNLWLAGNTGLFHLQERRLIEHLPWPALGHTERARVLVADGGGVWLSFWYEGGVSYYKDGRIRASYTAPDGLGKGRIDNLRLDGDGALWVASDEGGLSRIKDGGIATLTSRNGLPCDMIHWSMEDNDRSLWLYTACGLVRIARAELDAWIADPRHRVESSVSDSAYGVRLRAVSASKYSPTVARASDGKLWFVASEGVQIVNPGHLPYNQFPPPVHIEQITADDKTYDATNGLRLPPLTRNLQIDYTALSLVAPEKIHFKYKLEGQDRDWREVVNIRQAQYTNLPPGPHRFRVIACNNSGVWNQQGDTLEFSVAPAYYQTNWFRGLCALFLLGLVWAAYQWRVRQLRHQFEMTLDARVSERTRIARELHDTLLQSFHGVLLRFQTAFQLLPERPIEAKEKLGSALDQAAEAITEGRDAVQGLRDSAVQANDLALAISTLGEELTADPSDHRPAFRVAIEGETRNLHPIVRDEIYKIAGQALRNAFHHAHARQIEVEMRYDNEQFRLLVRDDGKGIDPAILSEQGRPGHFGLPGMRERATIMGAKLTIWSEVDSGTEVELRVPAEIAYAPARRDSWRSRFAPRAKV